MTQKTALILSVLLTAFVLVLGGGLVARVSQPAAPAEAAPVVSAPPAPTATIDVNAQVEQLLQQREAQYRQLIDEANQRLQQANQQLAAAAPAAPAAQPARSTAFAAPAQPAAQAAQPTASLSAEAARNIAIDASGGATMIREPELVLFEGKVAYEVGFTRGVVYVDANDGTVLFNGTHGNGGKPSGSAPTQPTSGEHESEHEDSHDGESHD
jgi:hypothetical protein